MILVKRYGLPPIISFSLYSVIYLISADGIGYWGWGLIFAVLLSYLIRVCDDMGDYQKDLADGKAVIGRSVLFTLGAVIAGAFLALVLFTARYLMLVSLAIVPLQFLIPKKYRDVIKPLFMPTAIVTITHSFFQINLWVWILAGVLLLADVILIRYKRWGRIE